MALTRDDLVEGLRQVVTKLRERGEPGGIRIVGGAALALRYFDRGTTDDIDAQAYPAGPTLQAVVDVAAENGWPGDWFNTAATQFITFAKTELEPLYDSDNVGIWVASARMLLAMKLRASRPGRDDEDIANLLVIGAVHSSREAEDLFEEYYPGEVLEQKAHRILGAVFTQGLPELPPRPPTVSFE